MADFKAGFLIGKRLTVDAKEQEAEPEKAEKAADDRPACVRIWDKIAPANKPLPEAKFVEKIKMNSAKDLGFSLGDEEAVDKHFKDFENYVKSVEAAGGRVQFPDRWTVVPDAGTSEGANDWTSESTSELDAEAEAEK